MLFDCIEHRSRGRSSDLGFRTRFHPRLDLRQLSDAINQGLDIRTGCQVIFTEFLRQERQETVVGEIGPCKLFKFSL